MSKHQWTRLKQATRETIKPGTKDQKTDIPNDIRTLLLKAEGVESLFADLIEQSLVSFPEHKLKTKNADDPVKQQPLYQMVHSFENMASTYQADQMTRELLSLAAGSMAELAKQKELLDERVHDCYVNPKRVMMADHIDEADARFDKLKQRRLDLDATKHKLKSERKQDGGSKMKKYELEVQAAQQRFDNELSSIRELLTPVADDLTVGREQCAQTSHTLQAMKDYFLSSYQILCQLDDKVNLANVEKMCNGASDARPIPMRAFSKSTNSLPLATPTSNRSGKMPPPITPRDPRSIQTNAAVTTSTMQPKMLVVPKKNQLKPISIKSPTAPSMLHSPSPVPMITKPKPPMPPKPSLNKYNAMYDFDGDQSGDLNFQAGDILQVTSRNGEWWTGVNEQTGERGTFPANYVKSAW